MIHRAHPALACLLLVLIGCGLKGPLYSPDEPKEEVAPASAEQGAPKRPAVPIPAPQSQKKDRQKDGATNQAPASDTATPATTPDPDRPAAPPTVPPPPDRSGQSSDQRSNQHSSH